MAPPDGHRACTPTGRRLDCDEQREFLQASTVADRIERLTTRTKAFMAEAQERHAHLRMPTDLTPKHSRLATWSGSVPRTSALPAQ